MSYFFVVESFLLAESLSAVCVYEVYILAYLAFGVLSFQYCKDKYNHKWRSNNKQHFNQCSVLK